jgi:hypothetical protein
MGTPTAAHTVIAIDKFWGGAFRTYAFDECKTAFSPELQQSKKFISVNTIRIMLGLEP